MSNAFHRTIVVGLASVALAISVTVLAATERAGATTPEVEFHDARMQAAEFIAAYRSIQLTPGQEEIKANALRAIPAPCCRDYSIATCCCPCNLAKSAWGLSHILIAQRGYDAARVKETVERWLRFTNPSGYTGDACYRDGCSRPFHENGCGGMDDRRIS